MAFLLTFVSLTLAGLIWMGLFLWLGGATSVPLNSAAHWLSPEGITGWLFYLVLAAACFLTFVKFRGGIK